MLHQADEKGQIVLADALFVQSEDEGAAPRAQQEVRILDPFGDPLEGESRSEIVIAEEAAERLVSVRRLGQEKQEVMPLDVALAALAEEAVPPDVARMRKAA